MHKTYDYIVIGAGAAGLGIAALLQNEKLKILTLEAHYYPGGCASYFFRNRYTFDVGATTLSGMKNNGPLKQFLKACNLELELIKIDPGIISCIDGKKIRRFSDSTKYAQELNSLFEIPNQENILNFLLKQNQIEEQSLTLINQNLLPKRELSELSSLIHPQNVKNIFLSPLLFKSYWDFLPEHLKNNPHLLKIFSEILFITAQNDALNTPALFGIMGVNYPADTYYHLGGMKGFIKNLADQAGEIKLRSMVKKITTENDLFILHTDQGNYKTKNVISSLPRKNNLKLLNKTSMQDSKDLWSAFTLYFTIPQMELESLYYQIHTEKIPYLGTESFFVSFSHPDDHARNHHQRLTVTISSHAQFKLFEHLNADDYALMKSTITNFIIQKFCENFNIDKESINHLESGTPKTFEFYTNRHRGEVGGVGHHLDQSLMSRIFFKDLAPNFYEIGDHVMPGQGIAAVLYGALALKAHLDRKN